MLNLDTYVLLHAVGTRAWASAGCSQRTPSMSAIVLWEIAKLAQLGCIVIDLQDPEVVRQSSPACMCGRFTCGRLPMRAPVSMSAATRLTS